MEAKSERAKGNASTLYRPWIYIGGLRVRLNIFIFLFIYSFLISAATLM